MANHAGSEGVVKVGANTVAEVKDWSLSESADTIEDTTMGDSARTKKVGLTSASGSVNCFWDETDTSGQGAMTVGASVTLNLYPEGATSGDTYASCTALITRADKTGSFDGMNEASFSFEATGAVTWATV